MQGSVKVLHITSHLGGGVGRALSKIASYNRAQAGGTEDSFICLEAARDARYAEAIAACGARILIAPDPAQMRREIEGADIVQLEWWHHPLMAKGLGFFGEMPARWVVWSHTSGLHYPAIPQDFSHLPYAFMTTTPLTLSLLDKKGAVRENLVANVSGTGGFDDFPLPKTKPDRAARCAYLGSFSPAKLHPDIMEYMAAIGRPDFHADFYGDSSVNPRLEQQTRKMGAASPIRLRGFCHRPQDVLPDFDIFIYLLNPTHFGATENALLEAMACGVVPVVLNNPVEAGLVKHGITGMVADSRENFAAAMGVLLDDPDLRRRMSTACSQAVRKEFSVANSAQKLADIYRAVRDREKKTLDFGSVFGKVPSEMFLSCLGEYAGCFGENAGEAMRAQRLSLPFLYEKSKSSVFQFCDVFPGDARLAAWAAMLHNDQALPENSL